MGVGILEFSLRWNYESQKLVSNSLLNCDWCVEDSRIANIKSWKSRENLSKNRSSNLRILWRTVCCWWPTSLWWLLNAEWASDHSDDCTPTLWQDGDLDLDSPVALRPALLLVLQRLQQTAPVQDGRVDAHVVHEGEGGVQAHVGLVHPVLPPPLIRRDLFLISPMHMWFVIFFLQNV